MTREALLPYADSMEAYADKFITPLSYDKGNDSGVLCGTGAFVTKDDKIYLITNAHIIQELEKLSQAEKRKVNVQCLFQEGEEYVPISSEFKKNDELDIAMADITDVWVAQKLNSKKAIPIEKFQTTEKIEGEYLFTEGYPSFTASMVGDTLNAPVQRFLTTETDLPSLEGRNLVGYAHFALKYDPDACYYTRKEMHLNPNPRGISGSIVWNTHLTDDLIFKKEPFNPENMTVEGIEFLWDEEKKLVCTKSRAIDFQNLI